MQSNVTLFLNVFVFGVVFRFAEALHEGFEATPMPVGPANHLIPYVLGDSLGGSCSLKGRPGAIVVKIVGTLHPLAVGIQRLMGDLAIKEDAAIGIPSEALVPEDSFIFLIQEGNALVVTHHMCEIGLDDVFLALVGEVEGSDCQIRFEALVFSILQSFIGSVIPKTGVFIAIVSGITQVLDRVLSYGDVHDIIGDIKVHTALLTLTSSAILAIEWNFDPPSLGVEALIESKSHSFLPAVEEVVFSEGLELNVALIGEINKLEFEVVPVVEGEGVGVDLLVKSQPLQGALVLELTRSRDAVI